MGFILCVRVFALSDRVCVCVYVSFISFFLLRFALHQAHNMYHMFQFQDIIAIAMLMMMMMMLTLPFIFVVV